MTDSGDTPALSETELSALHEAELGIEWLRRAHGSLVEVHHATGHAMDHLHDAEATLREAGHTALADQLRDELLPSGAIEDRWTYDLLETFEAGILTDVTDYERRVRAELADGERHITERRQERAWKRRASEADPREASEQASGEAATSEVSQPDTSRRNGESEAHHASTGERGETTREDDEA